MFSGTLIAIGVAVVPLVVAVPPAFARVTVHGEDLVVFTPIQFVIVTAAFKGNSFAWIAGCALDALTLRTGLGVVAISTHTATRVGATSLVCAIGCAGGIGLEAIVIRWVGAFFGFAHKAQGGAIKFQDLVVVTPLQDVVLAHSVKRDVSTSLYQFDA